MTTHTQVKATALEQARDDAGLTYEDAAFAVRELLGAYAPTLQTIRTYHRADLVPKKVNMLAVCALADLYDVALSEVAPAMADHLDAIQALVARSRCSTVSPGHGP